MRRLLWFRRDLRIEDHPLLALDGAVLPIFIFDRRILDVLPPNDRRITFIFEQVVQLKKALGSLGLDLALFYGEADAVISHLVTTLAIDEVCASGDFDAYATQRDLQISHRLPFRKVQDTYLFAPEALLKKDGTPYLMFTPFYRQAQSQFSPQQIQPFQPVSQFLLPFHYQGILHIHRTQAPCRTPVSLTSIGCVPTSHAIEAPHVVLERFARHLPHYSEGRDFPHTHGTSGLSVHLRFGTLSIRAVMRWLVEQKQRGINTEPLFRQVIFREFYAHMLYHFPKLQWENFRYPFRGISDTKNLHAFTQGRTGVPMVDAGVRQLLATGEMHNRVRMVCASFFTKHLLLPWQEGEAFFAAHLLDYDAASNVLSWQWAAGTGIDPQPYFRIFNPYLQSKKYDSDGAYIRRWVPELDEVPTPKLHDETWLLSYAPLKPLLVHRNAVKRAKEHMRSAFEPSQHNAR